MPCRLRIVMPKAAKNFLGADGPPVSRMQGFRKTYADPNHQHERQKRQCSEQPTPGRKRQHRLAQRRGEDRARHEDEHGKST